MKGLVIALLAITAGCATNYKPIQNSGMDAARYQCERERATFMADIGSPPPIPAIMQANKLRKLCMRAKGFG